MHRRVLVVLSLLAMCVHSAAALDYVESSPVGGGFPQWDGGDTEIEFADVDDDGNVDFLAIGDHGSPYINTDQHGIMTYFGDGAGGWTLHMEGNFGYGGLAIGDVDNDGHLDVGYGMHHDYSGTDFGDQLIEVALGDGSGSSWTPWDDGLASNGENWGMFATDFADVDADGDLDLASNSFGSGNGVHVYRNNGDGTWTQTWARTGGNADAYLTFGDVDGDGFPDIAATYQHGTVFLGDGEGGFELADTGLPPRGTLGLKGVDLGDIDGDGRADLSFTQDGGVFVYVWRGDHWESSSSGLPGTGEYAITQQFDMNVDGDLDVVALGDGLFTVWLGDGNGNWSDGGGFDSGPAGNPAALRVGGDIDHNGRPDVALVQNEGNWPSDRNHLHVYRETSQPLQRSIDLQFPRGNETFFIGSVSRVEWTSAQVGAGSVSVDLALSVDGSGGPWNPVALGLADGGQHQWIVEGVPTSSAHLRLTLQQDGEQVAAVSRAFVISGGDPTSVGEDRTWAGENETVSSGMGMEGARLFLESNPVRRSAAFRIESPNPLAWSEWTGWSVRVVDSSGRLVASLPISPAGRSEWVLADGRSGFSGVYWATLRAAGKRVAPGTSSQTPPAPIRFVVIR